MAGPGPINYDIEDPKVFPTFDGYPAQAGETLGQYLDRVVPLLNRALKVEEAKRTLWPRIAIGLAIWAVIITLIVIY